MHSKSRKIEKDHKHLDKTNSIFSHNKNNNQFYLLRLGTIEETCSLILDVMQNRNTPVQRV